MEIEIVTTKKKLTKSLIAQMPDFINNQHRIRTEHSICRYFSTHVEPTISEKPDNVFLSKQSCFIRFLPQAHRPEPDDILSSFHSFLARS